MECTKRRSGAIGCRHSNLSASRKYNYQEVSGKKKKRVKFTLEQATKAQWGRCVALLFLQPRS